MMRLAVYACFLMFTSGSIAMAKDHPQAPPSIDRFLTLLDQADLYYEASSYMMFVAPGGGSQCERAQYYVTYKNPAAPDFDFVITDKPVGASNQGWMASLRLLVTDRPRLAKIQDASRGIKNALKLSNEGKPAEALTELKKIKAGCEQGPSANAGQSVFNRSELKAQDKAAPANETKAGAGPAYP